MATLTASQSKYIQWLAKKDPFLLSVAIKRATGKNLKPQEVIDGFGGLEGFADLFSTAVNAIKNINFTSLTTTIASTAAQLAATKAQVKIIDAQTKLAIAGKPPIDTSAYLPIISPATYNPLDPASIQAVNAAAASMGKPSFDIQKILPWVALGLGGFLLLSKLRRK